MFLNSKIKIIFFVYSICLVLLAFNKILDAKGNFNNLNGFRDNSYSILGAFSYQRPNIVKNNKKMYAFLPYWLVDSKHINLDFITDLSYFGLNVDSNGNIIKSDSLYKKWRQNENLQNIIKKAKRKGINVSLTLICHDDETIEKILNCSACWNNLYKDLLGELKYAGIKDINIDFEYHGYVDKEKALKFADFVYYLNKSLDSSLKDSFVVVSFYADSASVVKRNSNMSRLTNPQLLLNKAEAFFIMGYDFHTLNSSFSGPVSPYGGSYKATNLNLEKIVKDYLGIASPSKLILGLPFYGYDWLVKSDFAMSERLKGSQDLGFSRSLVYHEIIDLIISKQIKPLWHEESKSLYFNYTDTNTSSKRQVWFDGKESLRQKANLAWDNAFLGVGVWALGFEGGYVDVWESVLPN